MLPGLSFNEVKLDGWKPLSESHSSVTLRWILPCMKGGNIRFPWGHTKDQGYVFLHFLLYSDTAWRGTLTHNAELSLRRREIIVNNIHIGVFLSPPRSWTNFVQKPINWVQSGGSKIIGMAVKAHSKPLWWCVYPLTKLRVRTCLSHCGWTKSTLYYLILLAHHLLCCLTTFGQSKKNIESIFWMEMTAQFLIGLSSFCGKLSIIHNLSAMMTFLATQHLFLMTPAEAVPFRDIFTMKTETKDTCQETAA